MSDLFFESANVVVVGTFNIHIFTPPWLQRCGVMNGEPEGLEFALSRPGFRVRLEDTGTMLTVDPQKIQVSTEDYGYDCGAPLAKILRKLPETPLLAVGTNVTFSGASKERESCLKSLPESVNGKRAKQHSASVKFEADENTGIAVSLNQCGQVLEASGNYETRSFDSTVLANSADMFRQHIDDLRILCEGAWQVKIDSKDLGSKAT